MRRVLAVLVLSIAALGVSGTAHAAPGAVVVKGVQAPAPDCTDPQIPGLPFGMTGGLLGCWYITDFVEEGSHPSGTASFSGAELFVGCIDLDGNSACSGNENGTFRTTFTFTAKFATTDPFAELFGRCHHPIVSGEGVFANARGEISFHDNVADGTADYSGPILL